MINHPRYRDITRKVSTFQMRRNLSPDELFAYAGTGGTVTRNQRAAVLRMARGERRTSTKQTNERTNHGSD